MLGPNLHQRIAVFFDIHNIARIGSGVRDLICPGRKTTFVSRDNRSLVATVDEPADTVETRAGADSKCDNAGGL